MSKSKTKKTKKAIPQLTTVQKFDNPIDLYKAFGLTEKEAKWVVKQQNENSQIRTKQE